MDLHLRSCLGSRQSFLRQQYFQRFALLPWTYQNPHAVQAWRHVTQLDHGLLHVMQDLVETSCFLQV